MSFESDMKKAYQRKVVGFQDIVVRKTTLDVQAGLDRVTPKDTGRASSNWLGSVASPRTDTLEIYSGSPQFNFAGYQNGAKLYISNNLPYIKPLNAGHSKQAPAGFVEAEVQRVVNRIPMVIKAVKV